MSCYNPLHARLYVDRDGNRTVKIEKYSSNDRTEIERIYEENRLLTDMDGHISKPMYLPCGQCLGCRLDHSLEWAQRCMAEMKYYSESDCHFVTFTYDDDNIPFDINTCQFTLLTRQEFAKEMKRLRERVRRAGKPDFRFFMCAEYGEHFSRPHYHVIFFGLELDDLVLFDRNKHLYRSKFLEEFWKKGFVSVGKVTAQSVAYVARYTLKKQRDPAYYFGRVQEWTNMSRNPGIGKLYLEENGDQIYEIDGIPMKLGLRVFQLRPCRYYDNLYDVNHHGILEKVKKNRLKVAQMIEKSKLSRTSLSLDQVRHNEERVKAAKIAHLRREFEEDS